MRVRLVFAALAVIAVVGVFMAGLLSGAAAKTSGRSSAAATSSTPAATSSPAATKAPSAAAPPLVKHMRLVFNAAFSRRLNTKIWDTCYPWANQAQGCTNFGNKQEVEWYMPSQVRVHGGTLDLVAKRLKTAGYTKAGTPKTYYCRSGMVTTHPGFDFEYGYVQVVARIPNGADLWPALWLAASNMQWPPEIDIIEHWGPPSSFSGAYFHPLGGEAVGMRIPPSTAVTVGWHTFAVDWTRSKVTWYVDGKTVLSVDQHIPHQDMYLIANLAAFQPKNFSSCSGTLEIRSVKVWQS